MWRDVLWSSFTDELTKIAMANAAARTARIARPRTQAGMPRKINKSTNANPAVGFSSTYSSKPGMVQPAQFPVMPGSTMQAPSHTVTGAGPVSSMPKNMPNPLTSGNIPPLQSSGPMNMMNTRR
ncbi:MAG: hypothetical protein VXZ72_04305 [Chlamydiota bacterium]|nr:hypothetical protein [Chlamydiota bacterium]